MLSPTEAAKGLSDTRKWGVKAHIERQPPPATDPNNPFNWPAAYEAERAKIRQLAETPPE